MAVGLLGDDVSCAPTDAKDARLAKAALKVYYQWEKEWVENLQKNDQNMTWDLWLLKLIGTVYPEEAGQSRYILRREADGQVVLREGPYRTCSMNETTYMWTSLSSPDVDWDGVADI